MIKNKVKFLLSSGLYDGENFEFGQKLGLFQDGRPQWKDDNGNGVNDLKDGETKEQYTERLKEYLREQRKVDPKPKTTSATPGTSSQTGSNDDFKGGSGGGSGTGAENKAKKDGVEEQLLRRIKDEEEREFYRTRLYESYTSATRVVWETLGRVPAEVVKEIEAAWVAHKGAKSGQTTAESQKTDAEARAADIASQTDPKGTKKLQKDRELQITRDNALTAKEQAENVAQKNYEQAIDSKRYDASSEAFKVNSQDIVEDRKTQNAIRDANLQKANDTAQERPKEQMFRLINQDLVPSGLMPKRTEDYEFPDGTRSVTSVQYGSVDFSPYMFERESTNMQYFSEFAYYYIPKDTYKLAEFQGGERLLNVDLGELSNKDENAVPLASDPLKSLINKPRRVFAKRSAQNKETIDYFYYLDESGGEHQLSPEQRLDVYCKGDLLTHPKLGDIENSTESLENYMVHADEANKLWFHGSLPKQAQEKFDVLSCIIDDPFVRRSLADLLGGLGQKSFLEIIVALILFFVNQSKGCLDEKIDTAKLIADINENPNMFSNMLSELESLPAAKAAFEALLNDPELMKNRKLNSVEFLELKANFYTGYLGQASVDRVTAMAQADEMFNRVISKFSPDTDALQAFSSYVVSDGKLSQEDARALQVDLADEGITGDQLIASLKEALKKVNSQPGVVSTPDYDGILGNINNLDATIVSHLAKKPIPATRNSPEKPVEDIDYNNARYKVVDIKTSVENIMSH